MNLRPEFLSPLRTLTGIDSPSGDAEGVTKAGDVMEGIFRNLGWETDRPEVGSYGGASDGNELASFGVAVIDALAPSGGLLHNPNKEYLDLATVEPRLRLIEKALELLAAAKTGASPAR